MVSLIEQHYERQGKSLYWIFFQQIHEGIGGSNVVIKLNDAMAIFTSSTNGCILQE